MNRVNLLEGGEFGNNSGKWTGGTVITDTNCDAPRYSETEDLSANKILKFNGNHMADGTASQRVFMLIRMLPLAVL